MAIERSKSYRKQSVYTKLWDPVVAITKTLSTLRGKKSKETWAYEYDADLESKRPWYIILPSWNSKQAWDVLILILVLYNACVIPLSIGFGDPRGDSEHTSDRYFSVRRNNLHFLDIITDVMFGIDIVLSFFTAHMIGVNKLEFDIKKIGKAYVWPGFVIDFLASFPFELLLGNNTGQIALAKVLRLPRLLRVSRVHRYFENFQHANLWRVFRLLGLVMMCSHWCLCGFNWVIISSETSTWTLEHFHRLDPPFNKKYFSVMHSTFLALYGGDSQPTTTQEQLYSCFLRLLGAVMQASIFGNVAMLLANSNASALEWRKQMDNINHSMRSMDIEPKLQSRIRSYFEHMWHTHGGARGKQWMWELTDSLHATVLMYINQHMISKVHLFKSADPRFVMALILKFQSKLYLPGDYIIRVGTIGKEMYFITKGIVEAIVDVPGQGPVVVSTLTDGAFFGEIALLSKSRRTASVRARTYADLNMLAREDFDEVCLEFPTDARRMRETARNRLMRLKSLPKLTKSQPKTGQKGDLPGVPVSPSEDTATNTCKDKLKKCFGRSDQVHADAYFTHEPPASRLKEDVVSVAKPSVSIPPSSEQASKEVPSSLVSPVGPVGDTESPGFPPRSRAPSPSMAARSDDASKPPRASFVQTPGESADADLRRSSAASNPLARTFASEPGGGIGRPSGLAPSPDPTVRRNTIELPPVDMKHGAPRGSLTVSSTSPVRLAREGSSRNLEPESKSLALPRMERAKVTMAPGASMMVEDVSEWQGAEPKSTEVASMFSPADLSSMVSRGKRSSMSEVAGTAKIIGHINDMNENTKSILNSLSSQVEALTAAMYHIQNGGGGSGSMGGHRARDSLATLARDLRPHRRSDARARGSVLIPRMGRARRGTIMSDIEGDNLK